MLVICDISISYGSFMCFEVQGSHGKAEGNEFPPLFLMFFYVIGNPLQKLSLLWWPTYHIVKLVVGSALKQKENWTWLHIDHFFQGDVHTLGISISSIGDGDTWTHPRVCHSHRTSIYVSAWLSSCLEWIKWVYLSPSTILLLPRPKWCFTE